MKTTTPYLFVYGTLLQPGNEFADYLTAHCKFTGKGKAKGCIYDIGEYPGAVISHKSEQYIYGSIFLMDAPETILKTIDDYEGIGYLYSQPQEYTREEVEIDTPAGKLNCWIYLYNLPIDAYPLIEPGDYIQYLAELTKK